MRLTSATTLRALIDQRGMSHQQVAVRARCHASFIDALTRGRKRGCTPALAERIAASLDVPLDVLFEPQKSSRTRQSVSTRRAS